LLHGAYADSRAWRPQLEALCDEFTVFAWDAPGCGRASAYAGWAGSLPPEEVERRYDRVLAELDQPPEQFIPAWLTTLFTSEADPAVVQEAGASMADFHPARSW
jgi:pimeloyl-ACP methyl ester carboxylesterase